MIPTVVADEVVHALRDFLITGFKPSNSELASVIDDFLEDPENLTRGPYLSLALPFRKDDGDEPFPEVPLGFSPYVHQRTAMDRLASASGQSTVVATGTGSGKTECYLLPILDYCREQAGKPGIKAIIIYPMNALAMDQATRIARAIRSNPSLQDKTTAGLYVGGREETPRKTMTATQVITDRETLRQSPPDILLTNYKMLDYLMIRPGDQRLWRNNEAGTLRYLVVDELHTFDGAQGTDLACLIRRLRARLQVPSDGLVCVGTSATIGTGDDAPVRDYVSRIFNQEFGPGSVVGETRQTTEEFLSGALITSYLLPTDRLGETLDPRRHQTSASYLHTAHEAFFNEPPGEDTESDDWKVALSDRLREHTAFRNLLQVLGGEPKPLPDVAARLRRTLPVESDEDATAVLNALCALISAARLRDDNGDLRFFLDVGVHLWVRELGRMVCSVSERSGSDASATGLVRRLRHSDDLQTPGAEVRGTARSVHLPLIQCRECRVTGWAAVKRANERCVDPDLRVFYNMFFRRDVDVRFLFPGDKPAIRSAQHMLCGQCGWLSMGQTGQENGAAEDVTSCVRCGSKRVVRVHVPDAVKTSRRRGRKITELSRDCPYCLAKEGLILFGARAASLTSVLCGQTFASHHNDDPKALAFSDNVQNAAHRAGFVAARSRQTHTRAAIAHVVAAQDGISLERLPRAVAEHWQEQADEPENFVGEHIADDRRWMRDLVHLEREGRLPPGSNLPKLVAKRLEWETLREFTFGSGIGRTLERTGAAAVALDHERVREAWRTVHTRTREEVGGLRDMREGAARALTLGVLRRMKDRGAIQHWVMRAYLQGGGNRWIWHEDPALPRFGRRSLIPVFPLCADSFSSPSYGRRARLQDGVEATNGTRHRSWYQRWCESVLTHVSALGPAESDHVLRLVFGALRDAGLIGRVDVGPQSVWALEPGHLSVTTVAVFLGLDGPGRPLSVAADDVDLWIGVPRLDGTATSSHYCGPDESRADFPDSPTWFGRLYREGQVRRIVAAEHTALVEREDRERLQRVFAKPIEERRPWEPNLVSATPTLELGIDIGDLSTVALCSVPPGTANYRQRAGRAGRRDGNALVLTVANAEPHDLYFYAEPLEMLAGGVDPPGIFLDAVAVLERQMTAFCLDNWVASGIPEDAVPKKIGTVLTNVEKERHEGFPFPFFDFVRNEETRLIEGFLDAFSGDLAASSRSELRRFVLGDVDRHKPSLILKILNQLNDVIKERTSVAADIRSLGERIRKLKSQPEDEATRAEVQEIEDSRKGLRAVYRKINSRDTFNFLTDEGLVPNYAFPEAGVKLRSVILTKPTAQDAERGSETRAITHEYERPAAMALGEFAPANHFYARAHQVEISRVDTRVSELERWRMCPSCVYAENVDAGDHHAACPRCGNVQWQDNGQLRDLLRLRLVHAVADARTSRIDDQKDDRERLFYTRNLIADFDPVAVEHAYAVRNADAAFGFEFIASATFREVNFGRLGQPTQAVTVAGMQLPREGFRICRRCGTVNSDPRSKPEHMPTCPARRSGQDEIVDCLYLYREFQSEAIRMLLPTTVGPDAERCERSFVAALELGLRKRFGGKIAHLRAMTCAYPVEGSDRPQRYMLLYDTVPGGTGYLKDQMTAPEKLLSVLDAALEAIEECRCNQDPERDGCHRCVLGYRRSRDMQETSRETARQLLRNILDARDHLGKVDGLRKVRVVVESDSELEDRFIKALRRVVARSAGSAPLRYDLVDGKPGYVLRVGGGETDGEAWHVVPQVDVGLADGVLHPSRPDFLIRPAKASAAHPPVAVFMDGFEYHRDIVHEDSIKRMALVRAGFVVWSATWHDVKVILGEAEPADDALLGRDLRPPMDQVQARLDAQWQISGLRLALGEPTLKLLGRYLSDPDPTRWTRAVFTHLVSEFDQATMRSPDFAKRFSTTARSTLPEGATDFLCETQSDAPALDAHVLAGFGDWIAPNEKDPGGLIDLFLTLPPTALQRLDPDAMWVTIHLHDDDPNRTRDDFRAAWNDVLRAFNLLQFLPLAWWTTRRGMEEGLYHELPTRSHTWMEAVADEPDGPETASVWADALRFAAEELRPALQRLRERDFPPPEAGYELTGKKGRVVADAELGWEDHRVVVLMTNQGASRATFESRGWRVVLADDDDLAGSIATLLSGDSR